jgi:hypothetical protein
MAVGALTAEPCLQTARAIMISGTCKCELARAHSTVLQTALDACKSEGERLNGHVYCVASDGEAWANTPVQHTLW